MARIGKSLTRNAGSKLLALAAAIALWILVNAQQASDEASEVTVIGAAVAVEPVWLNAESSQFLLEEFTVAPASLRIAGPADRVGLLRRLETEPIDLATVAADGTLEATVVLPDPQLRFVDNPIVRVELKVRRH